MIENRILDDRSFDTLFREARTYRDWKPGEVTEILLRATYDLMKFGPTSANCCPARFVFIKSPEAKARLKPHLDTGNVAQTMSAPVTAIIAHDLKFYEKLPKLYPEDKSARGWFEGNAQKAQLAALQNGSLQGAYLMLAARALGLDCGPMGGFNRAGVKAEFFADEDVEPNFLCNIGYGDQKNLHPRGPRLDFDEACEIL